MKYARPATTANKLSKCKFEIDDPDTLTNYILIVDENRDYHGSEQFCNNLGGGSLLSLTETRIKSVEKVLKNCQTAKPKKKTWHKTSAHIYRNGYYWRAGLMVKKGKGNWSSGLKYDTGDESQKNLFYSDPDPTKDCWEALLVGPDTRHYESYNYKQVKNTEHLKLITDNACGVLLTRFFCLVDKAVIDNYGMITTKPQTTSTTTTTLPKQQDIMSTPAPSTGENVSLSRNQNLANKTSKHEPNNKKQSPIRPISFSKINEPVNSIRKVKYRRQYLGASNNSTTNKKKTWKKVWIKREGGSKKTLPHSKCFDQSFAAGGNPSIETFIDEISHIATSRDSRDDNVVSTNCRGYDDVIIHTGVGIIAAFSLIFLILIIALVIRRRRKKGRKHDVQQDRKQNFSKSPPKILTV